MTDLPPKLREMMDRQEIVDLLFRYTRAIDRLDRELLLSVYWPDATDDRGFFQGTAQEFADFAIPLLATMRTSQHLMGQTLIEFEGPTLAFGEIYFLAQHRTESEPGEELFIGGRYVDRYEKRGAEWRIAHRSELNDWARTVPAADTWLKETPSALRGGRGADDLTSQRQALRVK
jgi:hypothetical protein